MNIFNGILILVNISTIPHLLTWQFLILMINLQENQIAKFKINHRFNEKNEIQKDVKYI